MVEISAKNLRAVIYIVVLNMKWRRQRVIQVPSIEKNSKNILECVFFLVLPAPMPLNWRNVILFTPQHILSFILNE